MHRREEKHVGDACACLRTVLCDNAQTLDAFIVAHDVGEAVGAVPWRSNVNREEREWGGKKI